MTSPAIPDRLGLGNEVDSIASKLRVILPTIHDEPLASSLETTISSLKNLTVSLLANGNNIINIMAMKLDRAPSLCTACHRSSLTGSCACMSHMLYVSKDRL